WWYRRTGRSRVHCARVQEACRWIHRGTNRAARTAHGSRWRHHRRRTGNSGRKDGRPDEGWCARGEKSRGYGRKDARSSWAIKRRPPTTNSQLPKKSGVGQATDVGSWKLTEFWFWIEGYGTDVCDHQTRRGSQREGGTSPRAYRGCRFYRARHAAAAPDQEGSRRLLRSSSRASLLWWVDRLHVIGPL